MYKQTLCLNKSDLKENCYKPSNYISELKLFKLICDQYIIANNLGLNLLESSEKLNCTEQDEIDEYIEYYQFFIIEPSFLFEEILYNIDVPFDVFYNEYYDLFFVAFSDLGMSRDGLKGASIKELEKIFEVIINE